MAQDTIKDTLIESYNRHAQERDGYSPDPWKTQERANFLSLLKNENKLLMLEIGAGTGKDSKFFSDQGINVTCVDLSPEMIRLCKEKGLSAHVMDMSNLEFPPSSFDAVYSFNSLLHIPDAELMLVLKNVKKVLKPSGLFFLGMYGGKEFEGIWEKDAYRPQRFFSFHTDERIQQSATQLFELLSFRQIEIENNELHFQSLTLRKHIS